MTRTTRPIGPKEGRPRKELSAARLDALIEEATVDASDESEQKTGFYTMLEDHLGASTAISRSSPKPSPSYPG